MPEFGVAAAERQRNAPLQKLGHAQQTFRRNERQDVGLLEVAVGRVDNERNASSNSVIETALKRIVTLFGVRQRHPPQLFFFGIVIEVDMLAAQHTPIKAAVLNLVLPEVAVLGGQEGGKCDRYRDDT